MQRWFGTAASGPRPSCSSAPFQRRTHAAATAREATHLLFCYGAVSMRSALQWNPAATLPPLTRIAAHAFILVADGGSGGLDEGDVVAAQQDAA